MTFPRRQRSGAVHMLGAEFAEAKQASQLSCARSHTLCLTEHCGCDPKEEKKISTRPMYTLGLVSKGSGEVFWTGLYGCMLPIYRLLKGVGPGAEALMWPWPAPAT